MINRTFTHENVRYRIIGSHDCVSGDYERTETEFYFICERLTDRGVVFISAEKENIKLDPIEGNTND